VSRRGFSIPELLVVVTIIAAALVVTIPVMVRTVRSIEVRSAMDQFTVSLRAARMQAVARNRPVTVTVFDAQQGSYYEISDFGFNDGEGDGSRQFYLPTGSWFTSPPGPQEETWSGSLEIQFNPNGSLEEGPRTVVIETLLGGNGSGGEIYEQWIARTNVIGATPATHGETERP